jgi:hypothetical protein
MLPANRFSSFFPFFDALRVLHTRRHGGCEGESPAASNLRTRGDAIRCVHFTKGKFSPVSVVLTVNRRSSPASTSTFNEPRHSLKTHTHKTSSLFPRSPSRLFPDITRVAVQVQACTLALVLEDRLRRWKKKDKKKLPSTMPRTRTRTRISGGPTRRRRGWSRSRRWPAW